MTRWADRGYFLGGRPDGPVGLFSPDQTKFAVVTKKGNLAVNTVEFSLLLFETKHAFKSPTPQRLITMSSSSNRDAIAKLKWLSNETLIFLGESPGESAQVYSLDIVTDRLKKLTNHPTSIVSPTTSAATARRSSLRAWRAKPGMRKKPREPEC